MTTIALMEYLTTLIRRRMAPMLLLCQFVRRLSRTKLMLVLLSTLLLTGSLAAYSTNFLAAYAEHDNTCNWYTVEPGDTLSHIAWHYHT
ncbi:MAG: LysM peptidoglycan-binding domain-containing protein, partial [Ktedonobacteraceae bacterium]